MYGYAHALYCFSGNLCMVMRMLYIGYISLSLMRNCGAPVQDTLVLLRKWVVQSDWHLDKMKFSIRLPGDILLVLVVMH